MAIFYFFITNCKYYCDTYRQLSSCINILKVKIYFHILNLFITGKLFTPIEVNLLKENFSKIFLRVERADEKTRAGVELEKIINKVPINIHKKSITVDAFFNAIIFVFELYEFKFEKITYHTKYYF